MKYTPTPTDRATGARIRQLRKLAGETQAQTIERSGVSFGYATLSRIEAGDRHISIPDATKLAAHFNTTVDKIIMTAPVTEQVWLGNEDPKPALFAVPEPQPDPWHRNSILIDRDAPMTPDEYREQVWIPYLENRYSTDAKAS